ncbi:MAG: ATP-dependent helicase RhlB, partial [Pseudomonadota bacterium]
LYAQGLPEIESYIEQKIPTAPVTSELLMAIPRQPLPKAEGGESIADIFNEVRANAPADKRGGPKSGRSSGGPRGDKPRSDRPRSDRPRSDKPRSERPHSERPAIDKPAEAVSAPVSDAARKPRRRRKPADAGSRPQTHASTAAPPAAKPSVLSRIKSWFTPSSPKP